MKWFRNFQHRAAAKINADFFILCFYKFNISEIDFLVSGAGLQYEIFRFISKIVPAFIQKLFDLIIGNWFQKIAGCLYIIGLQSECRRSR